MSKPVGLCPLEEFAVLLEIPEKLLIRLISKGLIPCQSDKQGVKVIVSKELESQLPGLIMRETLFGDPPDADVVELLAARFLAFAQRVMDSNSN